MTRRELRKEIKKIFPEAEISMVGNSVYFLAYIQNWRTMENGKYSDRYTGKENVYKAINAAGLTGWVSA